MNTSEDDGFGGAEGRAGVGLDRREFLGLAFLSSMALAFDPASVYGVAVGSGRARQAGFGPLRSLAPGDVVPSGWLRVYLRKQADELGGHLPEVSRPFTGAYWAGEEGLPDPDKWLWEQKGYWIDGALRCGLVLGDEKLLRGALSAVQYTLDHVHRDGLLGPEFTADPKFSDGNNRWPHNVFFRALTAHGEATGDPRVAAAMLRHYMADRNRATYGGPSRDVTNIEGMLWAYGQTGDKRLLAMAEKAWSGFLGSAAPGDRESGDLHPDRVFANTFIHSHGVTYAEKSKLPAILYMATGKPEYLRYAIAAQERVFNHHMLVSGAPSTSEDYGDTTALDVHETCDIVDHMWTWGYLLMATGDGVWGDRIERACFNAGMGALKKDWKGLQYFSCPNQVIATDDSSHVPFVERSRGWMAYRPNPGQDVACCGGNVHRLLPNYVIRMWMASPGGGLAACLYGACTVRAAVGSRGEVVEVVEETGYPFEDEIRFTLNMPSAVRFGLSLRIPGWCKSPRVLVNGVEVGGLKVEKGFVRLEREFQPGDRVVLTLPMHAALSYWPNHGFGVEHGPLVYSLPVEAQWSKGGVNPWSTEAFPDWNARPASAWNYALAFDDFEVPTRVHFERGVMVDDPWVSPPVRLRVPVKKVPGWGLVEDAKHPGRRHTPGLPVIDEALSGVLSRVGVEEIKLSPYGATCLRVTVFPRG